MKKLEFESIDTELLQSMVDDYIELERVKRMDLFFRCYYGNDYENNWDYIEARIKEQG